MTDLRPRFGTGEDLGDLSVVVLRGEIDMSSAPAIGVTVEARRRAGCTELTLDLSDVTFMDSQGLNELIRAHKALVAAGGGLRLREPSRPVELAIQIAGIDALIPIDA
jgi:stage II sporulation protein AA (anti-sigma F factor antagonist)